jgi:hypothetical protein
MNDVTCWKSDMEKALQDYTLNPCIKTADAMLRVALEWKGRGDSAVYQAGTVLAVVEEAKRIGAHLTGPAYLAYRVAFGIGYLLSRKEQTWNDYWAMRWILRQDPLSVEALHSRSHMKDEMGATRAGIHINLLLADRDFHLAFSRLVHDLGCSRCARIFFPLRDERAGVRMEDA